MWTAENRCAYERKAQRYPSDLTDEEWALVEPHLPPPRQRSRHKSPERRDVLDAVLYGLTTGCQWRALPKDFPPRSTVHDYFVDWHGEGTLTRIHNALYCQARELAGKAPTPTLSIVDSQSVKGAEKGGPISILQATMRPKASWCSPSVGSWSARSAGSADVAVSPRTSRTMPGLTPHSSFSP